MKSMLDKDVSAIEGDTGDIESGPKWVSLVARQNKKQLLRDCDETAGTVIEVY
jgi:hypothetical protein